MYDWFELLLPSSSERVRAKAREERSEGIATRVTAVVTVTKMHLKVHSASILNYDFQFDICVKEKKYAFIILSRELRAFFKKNKNFSSVSLAYLWIIQRLLQSWLLRWQLFREYKNEKDVVSEPVLKILAKQVMYVMPAIVTINA